MFIDWEVIFNEIRFAMIIYQVKTIKHTKISSIIIRMRDKSCKNAFLILYINKKKLILVVNHQTMMTIITHRHCQSYRLAACESRRDINAHTAT